MRTLRGAGQWLSERAEWCTKTSTPPPRGLMNPKPFSSYHFFTYPCSRSLRAKEAGAVLEKARRKKKTPPPPPLLLLLLVQLLLLLLLLLLIPRPARMSRSIRMTRSSSSTH